MVSSILSLKVLHILSHECNHKQIKVLPELEMILYQKCTHRREKYHCSVYC